MNIKDSSTLLHFGFFEAAASAVAALALGFLNGGIAGFEPFTVPINGTVSSERFRFGCAAAEAPCLAWDSSYDGGCPSYCEITISEHSLDHIYFLSKQMMKYAAIILKSHNFLRLPLLRWLWRILVRRLVGGGSWHWARQLFHRDSLIVRIAARIVARRHRGWQGRRRGSLVEIVPLLPTEVITLH